MIRLFLTIANPFNRTYQLVDRLKSFGFHRKISKNKSFEFEADFGRELWNLFDMDIDTTWFGSDHAGLRFDIELLGARLAMNLYDHRHWDYQTNDWDA